MDIKQKDRRFLMRGNLAAVLRIVRSEGNFVFDHKGKKYFDFLIGWSGGNLGWGNAEIKRKIKSIRTPDYVSPIFSYKGWVELAELLAKITPGKLKKSFRATGGTEAVEIAMQVAMASTGRRKFISIEGSYHGNSIATMSVSSSEFKQVYKNLLSGCHKIKPPLDDSALNEIRTLLKSKEIAGFIIEPVLCNLGVLVPEKDFLLGVQRLCKKYRTLLIADEVACGFGRTGKMFASEHFDLRPDILCMGKGITGGYAPMGATIITEKVSKSIGNRVTVHSTYGWHPLSVEAALATIRHMIKNENRLMRNVEDIGIYFRRRLSHMNFREPVRIHAKGLAVALHFRNPEYPASIVKRCLREGLLLESADGVITMVPAINIDMKTAEAGLNILESCL
jgi:acetylornithine/succinyldiaminopimelate/putrescine aminotransferase